MATECTVSAIGVETPECRRLEAEQLNEFVSRFGIPIVILTIVLIAAAVLTGLSGGQAMPEVPAGPVADAAPADAMLGESFYFLDHELAYGGGYGLSLVGSSRLTIGDSSDPVQYMALIRAAERRAVER